MSSSYALFFVVACAVCCRRGCYVSVCGSFSGCGGPLRLSRMSAALVGGVEAGCEQNMFTHVSVEARACGGSVPRGIAPRNIGGFKTRRSYRPP